MRQCLRCGTPTNEIECTCGSRTVEVRKPEPPREEPEQIEMIFEPTQPKGGDPISARG